MKKKKKLAVKEIKYEVFRSKKKENNRHIFFTVILRTTRNNKVPQL